MRASSRRSLILSLALAALAVACGGGDTPVPSVDGSWSATAQAAPSSLTLKLSSQDSTVSGAGVYVSTTGHLGLLVVAGSYQPPLVALAFEYDTGATTLYTARLTDANHMDGKLTDANGVIVELSFVRQ